jgi:peptide/nickel transport system substrate-binding protein
MLEQGDIDIAMNIDPDTKKELEQNPDLKLASGLSPTFIYLGLSTNPEISAVSSNLKFRQALAAAIDYPGITESLLGGNAVTPPSILPVGFLGADTVPGRVQDLEKSKALLTEAGYPDGVDIELMYPNTALFGVDFNTLAQKVQSDLAEVGIRVTLTPQELSIFFQGYRGQQDAFVIGYQTPDFPDPHANAWGFMASDGIFAKRLFYNKPENDALVLESITVTDPEARKAVYAKLLNVMMEDSVFIPVIQPKENIFYRNNVLGVVYHPVSKVLISGVSK